MQYLIGVDAGGTHTHAVAYDMQGQRLAEQEGGFGNITVDLEQAGENICNTLDALIAALPQDECVYLCLGIAGVTTGNRKERFEKILQARYTFALDILSDAMLALLALFEGQDGALVIAGTGSIAYGKKGDEYFRCGGYGTVLADEGSGYYLAVQAMKSALRRHDEGKPRDALGEALLNAVHSDNVNQLVELVTSGTKADVAALAPLVVELAEAGCESAAAVLQQAGEALGELVVRLLKRMQLAAPAVALSGSVIRKVMRVQQVFENAVRAEYPQVVIKREEGDMPKGAYYQYQLRMRKGEC